MQRGPKEGRSANIHVEGSHHRELCDMVMGVLSLQHPSGSQDRARGVKGKNSGRGLGQFGLFSPHDFCWATRRLHRFLPGTPCLLLRILARTQQSAPV